ncbi:hypothetical protein [uncultured Friedmanniella sp.]|uniref:hypothetical protein n=1 Tax=uncultured Friedmanniella sp. TaxID=335381 RepID=UPI0035CBBC70
MRRLRQIVAALLLSVTLTALVAGCGFDAQTNKPYTPADGTNADIGTDGSLKIRNLVIISRTEGEGVVSASLVGNTDDQLTSVSVTPIKVDGTAGSPVTAAPATPLQLGSGSFTVLTNLAPLSVKAADLTPGLTATVTMTFAKAGPVTLNCPVVDGTIPPWSQVTPGTSASPTPEPTPS